MPTDKFRNHAQVDGGAPKIPASDLLLHDAKSTKEVQHYHFTKVTLTSVFSNDAIDKLKSKISSFLTELLSHVVDTKRRTLIPAIVKCEDEILSNLSFLRRGIGNEAELRFALADPILKLFCSFWNLTVCGWGQYVVAGCLLS